MSTLEDESEACESAAAKMKYKKHSCWEIWMKTLRKETSEKPQKYSDKCVKNSDVMLQEKYEDIQYGPIWVKRFQSVAVFRAM